MPEGEKDPIGLEIGRGVVAQELWVAEDKPCLMFMVRVPGKERKERKQKGNGPGGVFGRLVFCWFPAGFEVLEGLQSGEREGRDDGRFLGQSSRGEEKSAGEKRGETW